MGAVLAYSVNVALLLVLMYVVYKWLLASESFHSFNRGLLLSIYVIALIAAPLVETVEHIATEEPSSSSEIFIPATISIEDIATKESPILPIILLGIYLVGVLVMLVRSVVIWSRIARIIASGEKQPVGRYQLVVSSQNGIAPFSWCKYIVINKDDYEHASDMIITHEMQHLSHLHWIDLLIAEAVIIFNWFNPAAWLMRDELQSVHEYQADMAVLRSGVNAKNYQLLLIKKAVGYRFPSLANSLNHSKLKKRIAMMMKNQSKKSARLRAIAIVPAVAVALLVVNQPAVASALSALSSAEIPQQTTDGKGSENSLTAETPEKKMSMTTITIKGDSMKVENDRSSSIAAVYVDGKKVEDINVVKPNQIQSMRIERDSEEEKPIVVVLTKNDSSSVEGVVSRDYNYSVVIKNASQMTITEEDSKINDSATDAAENQSDPEFYVDGVLTTLDEFTKIPSFKIEFMKIDKSDNPKKIYVTLKK